MGPFEGMPEHIAVAFDAYIALSGRRSLRSLAITRRSEGLGGRIATLKRWSARYSWQRRLAAHERKLVAKMEAEFIERQVGKTFRTLQVIHAAEDRFFERVLIDPSDPTLTLAQRRRAIKPTLNDWHKLLKIEKLLLGGEEKTPAKAAAGSDKPYTAEEIKAMTRALAQVRHNLPPQSQ